MFKEQAPRERARPRIKLQIGRGPVDSCGLAAGRPGCRSRHPLSDMPADPPKIEPIPFGTPRPTWSVMIPTYNCAGYLRETLASVLGQDPGPDAMQIEVVDDCSTKDDPEAVVRELGGGRVGFFRQPRNVGVTGNFNTCVERSKGLLVHILHGDDYVLPGFYERAAKVFRGHPEIGAVLCRYVGIDGESNWHTIEKMRQPTAGPLEGIADSLIVDNEVRCPAISVRRSVYEEIGGFDLRLRHAADWDMWRRIALRYPIWYEPNPPLACYRVHLESDTTKLRGNGANIADRRLAIELSSGYVDSGRLPLIKRAKEKLARAALWEAELCLSEKDADAAGQLVKEAFKTNVEWRTLKRFLRLSFWAGGLRLYQSGRRLCRAPVKHG